MKSGRLSARRRQRRVIQFAQCGLSVADISRITRMGRPSILRILAAAGIKEEVVEGCEGNERDKKAG